ncbi:hypothetical protein P153DRAFT_358429 [Dothidotthia symphoricarpi CBS 119687]|uniref:Uncharacterized protein n=1 Tax=Dothidotthia symphoricarpi CBS 119687 TaxID=1392245 RepID=A0A6A6A8Y7_9PLEO|nr:uncharacterized protein P153DRAFT_358429 [Dothidotthia symphoricarpi CBS 119687]KAF2127554.1 hypothetical protein P153DRAFT_358429 [Dothidotthia symphoricarpi CBS 119687]
MAPKTPSHPTTGPKPKKQTPKTRARLPPPDTLTAAARHADMLNKTATEPHTVEYIVVSSDNEEDIQNNGNNANTTPQQKVAAKPKTRRQHAHKADQKPRKRQRVILASEEEEEDDSLPLRLRSRRRSETLSARQAGQVKVSEIVAYMARLSEKTKNLEIKIRGLKEQQHRIAPPVAHNEQEDTQEEILDKPDAELQEWTAAMQEIRNQYHVRSSQDQLQPPVITTEPRKRGRNIKRYATPSTSLIGTDYYKRRKRKVLEVYYSVFVF